MRADRWAVALAAVAAWAPLPPPPPDAGDATARAEDILDQARYRPHEPNLAERVLSWIGERLADAFSSASSGGNRVLGFLIVVGGIVLIGRILTKLRLPVARQPADDDEPTIEVVVARTADSWAAEADECERAGAHTDAVRARYRWVLASVVEDGHLDDVPGRTSGEYRRLLRALLPDAADAVDTLTDAFEGAWYGHRTADADDAARARIWGDAVRRASAARRPEPVAVGADA